MALAALIASTAHAALAEAIKGEYRAPTEAEIAANPALKDHMILDVTPTNGYGLDNVDALKTTLGTERADKEKAQTALAGFTGLKADDVKAKLTRLADLEKIDPTKEADRLADEKVRGVKEQLVTAHNEEKGQWTNREKTLVGELDRALRVEAATKAITSKGGNPDVLLPHVLGATKFAEKDGKFLVQVVDVNGNPRIGNATGGEMTLDQLVDEFKSKEAFQPLFQASGKTGGGTTETQKGSQLPGTIRSKADLTDLNAKASFIEEHGQAAYLALPAAAAA